jgi:hypothetical protein
MLVWEVNYNFGFLLLRRTGTYAAHEDGGFCCCGARGRTPRTKKEGFLLDGLPYERRRRLPRHIGRMISFLATTTTQNYN